MYIYAAYLCGIYLCGTYLYIFIIKYYSAIKNNEIFPYAKKDGPWGQYTNIK